MVAARREQPSSDGKLVEACLRGESDAWETLVRRYGGLVYTVAQRYGLTDDDVADVFQNTWSALWEQLAEVRHRERLSPWLITVAARLSYQQLERCQRQEAHQVPETGLEDELDAAAEPEEIMMSLDEAASVRAAMEKLPERCRELLSHLFYDDEAPTYAEIGRRLGMAEDSIGPTRRRCLRHLRMLLEEGQAELRTANSGRKQPNFGKK